MEDKNKNKKMLLPDFLRYQKGEMSGVEKNSFERELQKDPFAEEAAEGLAQISSDSIQEDIQLLHKRLNKKQNRKSPAIVYSIAAAFALLMAVSSIFFITQKKNRIVTLSENIRQDVKSPVSVPEPETLPPPSSIVADKKMAIPPSVTQKSKKDDKAVSIKIDEQLIAEQNVAEPEQLINKDSDVTIASLSIAAADEVATKTVYKEKKMDMARSLGAPANPKSEVFRDYLPAQPVVGRDSFDIYLEKNIRNPKPGKSLEQIVIVSFKVHADSTISGIKIINSPGQTWSREAVRLIKEGPSWKPAEENGKVIEDEVRVSIVFR